MDNSIAINIALFGEVNVGKSSIINALLGKGTAISSSRAGQTTEATVYAANKVIHKDGVEFLLQIIDTPGIGEYQGADNATKALDAARHADLILFIAKSDLNEIEYPELVRLHKAHKPIILVLNQVDKFKPHQLQETLVSIKQKTRGIVDEENILLISAAPIERVAERDADGNRRVTSVEGCPEISPLKARIIDVIRDEGILLKDLSRLVNDIDDSQSAHQQSLDKLKELATEKIELFAIATAVGVGANPVPLLDLLGGGASVALLVSQLGELYQVEMTDPEINRLARQLWEEGKILLAGTVALNVVGSILKSFPGFGTVAGAVVQGGPAGYFVYILGLACIEYFSRGKAWAPGENMHSTLKRIVATTDKKAITAKVLQGVKERVGA